MTKEQKTIKLAEFEGYKSCGKQFYGGVETWRVGDGPALLPESLPKYFEDLNAVQKLINKLDILEREIFVSKLYGMSEMELADAYEWCICDPTAEQKSEAIGQTLKLW